jgi:hypothetical protein
MEGNDGSTRRDSQNGNLGADLLEENLLSGKRTR